MTLDCTACGACCTMGSADGVKLPYLPITKAEMRALPSDVTVHAPIPSLGKVRSLRFLENGRCAALDGVIGLSCRCRVYDARPRICRVFPPGSPNCLQARADAGLVTT